MLTALASPSSRQGRDRRDEAKSSTAPIGGQVDAIHKSQAVIEFNLDGTIIVANENFLATMGYTLAEVQGKHHSLFVEPGYRDSAAYKAFWAALGRGEYQAAEYKRLGKGGREVWIQASYNPILDLNGKPFKVVKFATDVTKQKLANADYVGQIDAILSQAVIEFGTIITANQNFLDAMGYTLAEIRASITACSSSPDTARRRIQGLLDARARRVQAEGQAPRQARARVDQASYNPILDNGKPFKVAGPLRRHESGDRAQTQRARARHHRARRRRRGNSAPRSGNCRGDGCRATPRTPPSPGRSTDQSAQRSLRSRAMGGIVEVIPTSPGINLLAQRHDRSARLRRGQGLRGRGRG